MARDEAKTTLSADDAELQKAWDRQFSAMQKMEQAVDRLNKKSKESQKASEQSFGSMLTGAIQARFGVDALTGAIQQAIGAQQQYNKLKEGEAVSLEKARRAFQVATRGKGDEAAVVAAAERMGVDDPEALLMAAGLARRGVAVEDLPGMVRLQIAAGEGGSLEKTLTKLRTAKGDVLGQLGLSEEEAGKLPADQLIMRAAAGFAAIGDERQQMLLARAAFGKEGAGEQLGGLLRLTPEDLARYQATAATQYEQTEAEFDPSDADWRRARGRQLLRKSYEGRNAAGYRKFWGEMLYEGSTFVGVDPGRALNLAEGGGGEAARFGGPIAWLVQLLREPQEITLRDPFTGQERQGVKKAAGF